MNCIEHSWDDNDEEKKSTQVIVNMSEDHFNNHLLNSFYHFYKLPVKVYNREDK